ncbi:hypothetical protein CDD83_5242 [Cordyceps sp. RAO-2017]|nr:hypothetical protein CDD83_5242 [Cordyceps sp. RAO-2017]
MASDGGKASTVKRSSSVHSARIVEVSGPRSPAHSRHTSVDTSERPRRISPSGLVSTPRSSIVEDEFKSRFIEHDVESPAYSPAPCPSLDRRRPPRPAAVPISETDEDRHRHRRDSPSPETGGASRAAHAPAADILGVRAKKEPAAMGAAGNRAPATNAMRREHTPSHIKVTTAAKGSSASAAGSFLDETIPEIPPKAPGHSGWQSPKADGRGTMPIERSKTRETDEDPALSSQNNATPRQIHTSGSSASSATSKLKPLRTSEENSSRAESVARNFEELIHSNQTITYTLTPENMRDIDSKRSLDSPVVTKFTRKSEETRGQNSPRSSPIAVEAPKSPLTHHHQPLTPTSPRAGDGKAAARSPGQVPVPRIPPGLGASSAGRAGGSQAREARNQGESTADFADFIKYSGPAAGERAAAPRLKIKTPTSPAPSSGGDPPSTTSSMNRGRYQPREAAVDTKVDSSDLIDFIRQGPPIAASNHRIPRHVAPFRSTMDSDQMSGAGGGMAVDATIPEIRYSQGSTNFTDNSMPSMQSGSSAACAIPTPST